MSILYDMRSGELVKSRLYSNNLLLKDSLEFNPLSLFKDDKQGVWYDPSDKSTMFQDVAGTVPVTKDGDPVALMKDKSGNGNHATQTMSAARPTYRTDGILHWLQADGVDDRLASGVIDIPQPYSRFSAWLLSDVTSDNRLLGGFQSQVWRFNGRLAVYYGGGVVVTTASVLVGIPFVFTEKVNGPSTYIAVNKDGNTVGGGSRDMQNLTLFTRSTDACGEGRFFGVLVCSGVLDATSTENIQEYFAKKAGVTL